MKVRTYLAFLILGYSICGLTVFTFLNWLHAGETQIADNASRLGLVLRDVDSLERNYSHWMLLSDLVLGADESYLCDGAIKLGDEVDSILQTLSNEVNPKQQPQIRALKKFSARQVERLTSSRSLNDEDRQTKLYSLLMEMDSESTLAIESLEQLDTQTQASFRRYQSDLRASRSRRTTTIGVLLLGFLGSTLLLWLWISSIVSQPISTLANQSRIGDESTRNFTVKTSAPHEVQQLASSLSQLVGDLEYQITEHEKTQAERTKLHHKLMDASRRAGMADVASEVLHNVGNVLNSLNVSTTLINSTLRKSLVPKLAIANQHLSDHADNLGEYLERDTKGKHFPAALAYMADALVADQNVCLKETESLQKNLTHVKNVIHGQLSLSRNDGVLETFCLLDMLQECHEISNTKAQRYQALLTLECPRTLNVKTDRHQLQQIVINLISNAIDAVAENTMRSGRVEVVVENDDDDEVTILVLDNGVGIPPENLTKIFMQGFTTKANGHGFGLHSCAVTAQILGGNLQASSDGIGLGSCFKLQIPLRKSALCKV